MRWSNNDKQALFDWEEFRQQVFNSTTVDINETEEEKIKRMKQLEKPGNEEDWFKFYFPKFCFCKSAKFHRVSTRKFLRATRFKQGRRWFRGSSKSTRRMMEVFYKMLVQKFRTNCLLISKTNENAERLLAPYKVNLEANQRIINDYGMQEKPGSWTASEFITRSGHSFRAVGAGQNPRGARLDELRITMIIFDDLDDDEVSRNPDRVQAIWEWVERAVIPTVDIAGDYLIVFDNNLIAEDSCAMRFGDIADDVETVNVRDEEGNSSWPEKNSIKDIEDMENSLSYEAIQQEFYNNPIRQGVAFKEMVWGKCPPLKDLPFVIVYADPSTSNKDKPTLKSKAGTSFKAVFIVGYKDLKFYVYTGFLDRTSNSIFVDWLYAGYDYVNNKTQCFHYIENNTLQDPFYQQVLMPLIHEKGKAKGFVLPVSPDAREKPEKWFRIEGTLEPLNRMGLLVLNIDEKDNPHMKRLEAQFKAASANNRTLDGPDAIEGGVFIIKNKVFTEASGNVKTIKRTQSKKRF